MKTLDIVFPDGELIAIAPVRCVNRQSFDWLLGQIHLTYQTSGLGNITTLNGLAQKLVNLLPRVDLPGTYGFEVDRLFQDDFINIFIHEKADNDYLPCRLVQLHSFNAPPSKPTKETKDKPPPIPSSGLPEIDLFASLIGIDETIEGAWLLWNNLDLESVFATIHQLNELRKTPEERMNEYLADKYEEIKAANSEDFYQQIGIFE